MKKKIFSLIAMLAILIMPITFVHADEYFNTNDNVSDSSTYDHSHFEAGNIVKSESDVNGLSFVAGSSIDINGQKEYGFFAAESVNVNGVIEKDLFAAGNTININKESSIGRDLYLAGNSVSINSDIKGTAFIGASLVTLNNVTIDGDVNIAANTLQIDGKVTINGKLKINDNVVINNENNLNVTTKEKYASNSINIDFKTKASEVVISILTSLFTGIILVLLFPNIFRKIKYDLDAKDIGKKLLYGLLVLLVVPMICIVSLSIIVGLSVSVIGIMLYICALMIASSLASVVIGQNIYTKLFKQKDNLYISMMIGILVVKLVELIPVVGGLISFFVFLYGLGIICNLFLERNK